MMHTTLSYKKFHTVSWRRVTPWNDRRTKTEHDTHSPWARSTLAARDLMLAGKLALAGRFFCRVERSVWAFLRLLATLRRLREFESNWEPLPSTGPAARTESTMAFQWRLCNWRSSGFLLLTRNQNFFQHFDWMFSVGCHKVRLRRFIAIYIHVY